MILTDDEREVMEDRARMDGNAGSDHQVEDDEIEDGDDVDPVDV